MLPLVGVCDEGYKRSSLTLSAFAHYEICKNGVWVEKCCPNDSLFWNTIQCCIPLREFPSKNKCLPVEDERYPLCN